MALTIFIASVFLLQGVATHIEALPRHSDKRADAQKLAGEWYPSLLTTMISLLASFTGGVEWINLYEAMKGAGWVYSAVFICYILFVMVGVFNILTAVFLANAGEITDHDLIVQDEEIKMEDFLEQLEKDFVSKFPSTEGGYIEKEELYTGLEDPNIQAFLRAYELEPTHLRLVFEILDVEREGRVDSISFLAGLMEFKGGAKTADTRTIQYQLGLIPMLVRQAIREEIQKHAKTNRIRSARGSGIIEYWL